MAENIPDARQQIDELRAENDAHRAWLDSSQSQHAIGNDAAVHLWELRNKVPLQWEGSAEAWEEEEYAEHERYEAPQREAEARAMAYMESDQYLEDQGAIVERRWMAHEAWLASGGQEGAPHHAFLDGQTEAEALMLAAQERLIRQEQQRLEAAVQLQAFEGKTPEAQQQVYIQQVTKEAIRTGIEEGYPIRDRPALEKHVADNATPENVATHQALLRAEVGMPTPWVATNTPSWERGADTERSR